MIVLFFSIYYTTMHESVETAFHKICGVYPIDVYIFLSVFQLFFSAFFSSLCISVLSVVSVFLSFYVIARARLLALCYSPPPESSLVWFLFLLVSNQVLS